MRTAGHGASLGRGADTAFRQDILTTWSWWEAPVTGSAHRHGYVDEDIRHALRNLVAVATDPRDDDITLFLGPDQAANLIEVGILSTDDGPLIIHAMAARTRRFRPPKE